MFNEHIDTDLPTRFTGHETFPLRLLWLKKAYDAVREDGGAPGTFHEQSAIARFGVGRNMVMAMRHWALAAGVISEDSVGKGTTPFSDLLLQDDGLDPYLERPATLWLLHCRLVESPGSSTTFFYAFNVLNRSRFSREDLTTSLTELARTRGARASVETVKRDVEVFVRSYTPRPADGEDAAEPLLTELGLLQENRRGGELEFTRGPKNSLPDGIFAEALKRFWERRHPNSPTLSVEMLSYAPGSPGRIFKLDEDSLVERLMRIGCATSGAMEWTDTAGLRQVVLRKPLAAVDDWQLIRSAYVGADA